MEFLTGGLDPVAFALALIITACAGFVKGAVGFAMPMIMISFFGAIMPPETALAGLILPTLVTNVSQALRQGWPSAQRTMHHYRRFLLATVIAIALSAQAVRAIPQDLFLLLLGLPITYFALLQLSGRNLMLRLEHRTRAEWILGALGGLYGGISGVWGPTLMVYLLSIGADKAETLRVQGVVFLIGAAVLLLAHLQSGLLTQGNLAFSAALILPAMIGQAAGFSLHDRLDQTRFRRWTQILLALTGLNLLRRSLGI